MQIFTTWVSYGGKLGITNNGEYYDLEFGIKLNREVHCGAIYYRASSSKKRYSWAKANKTKVNKIVGIIEMPLDISTFLHSFDKLKVYTVLPRIVEQFDTYIPV